MFVMSAARNEWLNWHVCSLETERNKRADAEAELRQVVKKAVAYRQKVADAENRVSALSEVHADLEAERALRDDLQAR
jgi:hypothetical protein